MAKPIRRRTGNPYPDALNTVRANGKAPESRFRSASQVYEMAAQLDKDDSARRKKRNRLFKAYNRFPPNSYSRIAKENRGWSNVNWGMLAYVIDNNKASFYDMLTERPTAATIKTKIGNVREREEYGQLISLAWDTALDRWDEFLINHEEGLLDQGLYGKGVEVWEDESGWMSEHCEVRDLLVPDDTDISLSKFDVVVRKRKYNLTELYTKIQNPKEAEARGWNVAAVIDAMRWQRESWSKKTSEDFMRDIKEGNISMSSHLKEKVAVYIAYVKEYSGKVSKHIVLQDYAPLFSLTRTTDQSVQESAMDTTGFLFSKTGMYQNWKRAFAVFFDDAGSGQWHNTPSLAEKVFVQCRQYDATMNAIMDAVRINMSLILKGVSEDSGRKLKEVQFGPTTSIPSDLDFNQQRIALPVQEAMIAVQTVMRDMRSGIGQYQINAQSQSGGTKTATQSNQDASEAARLNNTQIRRWNKQHSFYYRELYRRFVSSTKGSEGYDIYEQFEQELLDQGVPKEAWAFENITSIKSNILAGAGSPSYKLMAAEKTIELTNITPASEGQAAAVEEALASLHGRDNVRRFMPKTKPDPTINERWIGMENESFGSWGLNPANVRVYPTDDHISHFKGHAEDMLRTIALVNKSMQTGQLEPMMAKLAIMKLVNGGAHMKAHLGFIGQDKTKKPLFKQFNADLNMIQREADAIAQRISAADKSNQENGQNLENDPEIRRKLALSQIEIDTKQKLAQISIGAIATKHATRIENDREAAANRIAIETAQTLTRKQDQDDETGT